MAKFNLKRLFRRHTEDNILHQVEAVQNSVHAAAAYLKEKLTHPKAFQEMPWYLVLGEKSSGKSQLLAHSNLSFLDKNKFVQLTPEHSETRGGVNWWISSGSVMIDVPGYYLEETEELTPARAAWLELLHQIRRHRFYKPLNGVIVALECSKLFPRNENAAFADFLKSRLLEISYQLKQQLPIYLVVTKFDCVQGFNAYFDDLGKEEREQCCGLTFPLDLKSTLSWAESFEKQFDVFTTHLHQRALFRVHQERQLAKRQMILNFPHQVESIEESLKKIVYAMSTLSPSIFLRGIYFTSSLKASQEETKKIDFIGNAAKEQFELAVFDAHSTLRLPKRGSFFISGLFEKRVLAESHLSYSAFQGLISPWENILRWGALCLSGLIICASLVFFTREYHHQTKLLSTARTAFSDYKLLSLTYTAEQDKAQEIEKLLPALDALSLAYDNARRADLPWLLRFQLHFKNSLYGMLKSLYFKELTQRFVPALRLKVETQLQNQSNTDATELYGLLKTYLMLGSPNRFDSLYLKKWFSKDFHDPIVNNADFRKHLDILLSAHHEDIESLSMIPNNTAVVAQTRNTLNALPIPVLAKALFYHHSKHTMIVPVEMGGTRHTFDVPKNFYLDGFAQENVHQLSSELNEALLEAVKGNWILGDKVNADLTPEKIVALQKSQLLEYQMHQADLRQEFLAKIKMKKFSSLAELDLSLEELTSKKSPLIAIVNFMQESNQSKYQRKFQKIPLNNVFRDLQTLEVQIIRPLLNSADIRVSALLMAQNIAKQTPQKILYDTLYAHFNPLPEPLRTWLLSLTDQSRQLIFAKGKDYANHVWQSQVYPVCEKRIAHHFPFDPNAEAEVSLRDFSRFFEKNGILNQFMTIYLSPFIDMSGSKWRWKDIDGLTFSQNTDFLNQLERAQILQAIYFNQKNQLEASFNLTAQNHTNHYVWPINTRNIKSDKNESDWSIFRMLHEGVLKPTEDHQYNVILNNMNYTLIPDSAINPFIDTANNISLQFKCQKGL